MSLQYFNIKIQICNLYLYNLFWLLYYLKCICTHTNAIFQAMHDGSAHKLTRICKHLSVSSLLILIKPG